MVGQHPVGLWLCQRGGLTFYSEPVGFVTLSCVLMGDPFLASILRFSVSLGIGSTRAPNIVRTTRSIGHLVAIDSNHHELCTCVGEGRWGSSYLLSFHNDALLVT